VSSSITTFQHRGKSSLTTWFFEIAKGKAIDFSPETLFGYSVD